jgi:hypothetical protein
VFKDVCAKIFDFVEYVQSTADEGVNVWTDRIMHIWNTTNNRVEFAHSRLKKYLVISLGEICKKLQQNGMH